MSSHPSSRLARLAGALDRIGMLHACLRARALTGWPRWGLTVLVYHRVADCAHIGELDPDLVDASPELFDRQMATISRHFNPVTLDEVIDASQPSGRPLPPNAVLVTFDDGYRDNLEVAVPILKKHGIRATFFVATGYMDQRRLFWWERVRVIVNRARVPILHIKRPVPLRLPLETEQQRHVAGVQARRIIKETYDLDLDAFLAELSNAAEVPWTPEEDRHQAKLATLDWDGVRALRDEGMDVASHTRNHRVLQTLPAPVLAEELAHSKAELEHQLGRPVRAVAYPVGRPIADFPHVRDAVRAAGYHMGFSVKPRLNRLTAGGPGRDELYDVQRFAVDRVWSLSQFRATLIYHAFSG